jgi:hypothetical protein
MPTLSKTRMFAKPMFYETVKARPDTSGDVAFDSTFEPGGLPGQNYTLRISLRVFYRQINPPEVTAAMMSGVCASLGIPVSAGSLQVGIPIGIRKIISSRRGQRRNGRISPIQ